MHRHRKLLAWLAGSVAALLVATATTGYLMVRHFNDNITQVNLAALVGTQSADTGSRAENILVIGSDAGLASTYGDTTTGQPDTIMLLHVAANRKWAEAMSIPRDSWGHIASCETGGGGMSAATRGRIGTAFALGGQQAAIGATCLVKTLKQDTGISIGHFIVVDLAGFQNMVAALGGVRQCVQPGLTDPNSGITIPAGCYELTPAQALAYVRARSGTGAAYGDDLARIVREQALVSSLLDEAKSKLLNVATIYKFANAVTSSLTTDSSFGGLTGLYDLAKTLHSIPSRDITQFTVPNYPRSTVVPSDTSNVLWTQPQSSRIFAAIREDKRVTGSLYSR